MLDKTIRVNRLFDYYSELLTCRQREVLKLYFRRDFSLSEIAEAEDCSRQAIHDLVTRSAEKLEEIESKLQFMSSTQQKNEQLREVISLLEAGEVQVAVDKLKSLVNSERQG